MVTASFLTELTTSSERHDYILFIADKLSDLAGTRGIFVPTSKAFTAPGTAELFQDHLFTNFGETIWLILDRDAKSKYRFWRFLAELLRLRLNIYVFRNRPSSVDGLQMTSSAPSTD